MSLQKLKEWVLLNTAKNTFDLNNAAVSRQFGLNLETIPFGSTVNITQPPQNNGLAKGLLCTILGGSLLGGGYYAKNFFPPGDAPAAPKVIEGQIDFEVGPDGKMKIIKVNKGSEDGR